MSVRSSVIPNNRTGFSTLWVEGTGEVPSFPLSAAILLVAAAATTLTISSKDPRIEYGYECVVFVLAAILCRRPMALFPGLLLSTVAGWGFLQLVSGATVYRYATLQSSLRFAALAATALVSARIIHPGAREKLLRAFCWFGVCVAALSVIAYFQLPGKILWMYDAAYPDVWGPFLSRNNFAQFLELAMPVALWLALRDSKTNLLYLCFGAILLAAGLASASRAGAMILVLEAVIIFWIRRRSPVHLILVTVVFALVAGVGQLAGRLFEPDPYQGRREIAHSTLAMIAARPLTGFGLGTFPTVYPEYASFDVGHSVDHAHNDWLEWASEGGVGFAAVWMALAAWSLRRAARSVWGIGVLGCFLHALVDYPFARFGIAAWVFIFLGLFAASDVRKVRPRAH